MQRSIGWGVMGLLCVALTVRAEAPAALPALPALPALDTQGPVSVSGVSSGAYMAVQLQFAQAPQIQGLAAVAGGPYACAESLPEALGPCLGRSALDLPTLLQRTQAAVQRGEIPAPDPAAPLRAYLFSGALDKVVGASTTAALAEQLRRLWPRAELALQTDLPATHGWVTDRDGGPCDQMTAPFLLRCGFDLAGALLTHLHGPLQPRAAQATGRLLAFDQTPFRAGPDLGEQGYVYIPQACEAGGCRLHLALHGCRMNHSAIGDAFVRRSGLNEWADSNRLVVLYPQTGGAAVNGCWDWWGYGGPGFGSRDAPQMRALMGMLARLGQGPVTPQ